MTAFARHNLELRQGVSFENGFQFFTDEAETMPLDLNGWTFKAEIRSTSGVLIFDLEAAAWGDPTEGVVSVAKPAAAVIIPVVDDDDLVETFIWDLIGTSEGNSHLMVEGFADIGKVVTQ